MILNKEGQIGFLQFSVLKRLGFVEHAVFTRHGGFSHFPFGTLNISLNVGDNDNYVKKNRLVLDLFFGGDRTLYLQQEHTSRVIVLTKKTLHLKNIFTIHGDAIITNVPGLNIAIQTADCQAGMIVDSTKKVIANVHVGWRGSIGRILEKTVDKMVQCFSCDPSNMIATLGPSLGPCCAEFVNYRKIFPSLFFKYRVGKSNFNFWEISKRQLREAGVPYSSIYYGNVCTRCNNNLFFSYRRMNITGRFASLIRINK